MTTRDRYSRGGEGAAASAGGDVRDQAGEAVGQAQQAASQAADQAQQAAGQVAEQAQQQAKSVLSSQKDRAAEQLGTVAEAVQQTGEQLRQRPEGAFFAQYADQAAQRVDQLSSYLRETDVEEIIHETERFARREPALFLGAALALGFLGARFLKSSSQARREMDYSGGYPGAGGQGPSGYRGRGGRYGVGPYPGTADSEFSGYAPGYEGEAGLGTSQYSGGYRSGSAGASTGAAYSGSYGGTMGAGTSGYTPEHEGTTGEASDVGYTPRAGSRSSEE